MRIAKHFGFIFAVILILAGCKDVGKESQRMQALLDSISAVKELQKKDSLALEAATAIDTSISTYHARYLDFETENVLQIVVKDDSGNMQKFLVDPKMPVDEWKAIQKPAHRGKWMLLEFRERDLLSMNDSIPVIRVSEVVKMKMLE